MGLAVEIVWGVAAAVGMVAAGVTIARKQLPRQQALAFGTVLLMGAVLYLVGGESTAPGNVASRWIITVCLWAAALAFVYAAIRGQPKGGPR